MGTTTPINPEPIRDTWDGTYQIPAGRTFKRPARMIDFRCRPNTETYMALYDEDAYLPWYGFAKPESLPLKAFIGSLDEAGITHAVFSGRQRGTAGVNLSNDYIADCVKAYPERIIGLGGVDALTLSSSTLQEAHRCITTLGLKGIATDVKGVQADDRRFYPLYMKCLELDVPIVLTVGPRVHQFHQPEALARVADDFPELKILCSHSVYPRADDWIALAYTKPNVFLELSAYNFMPGGFDLIMEAARTFLQDKVVFGSAFPFLPLSENQRVMHFGLPDSILDKVLYQTGARLLKIQS